MRFPFNETKAAQAAAHILRRHGGAANYMVLVKLLYYADREAMLRRGAPITGDRMASMRFGPVLSTVLDLVRGKRHGAEWSRYISEKEANFTVRLLLPDPPHDELSEFEMALLNGTDDHYGAWDPFDLSAESHNLPEWTDPGDSSLPIEPEDILRGEGRTEEEVRAMDDNARLLRFFDETLG